MSLKSLLSKSIEPDLGTFKPHIMSIKDVFPEPDSPLIPIISPLLIIKFTLFKITFSSYEKFKLLIFK